MTAVADDFDKTAHAGSAKEGIPADHQEAEAMVPGSARPEQQRTCLGVTR